MKIKFRYIVVIAAAVFVGFFIWNSSKTKNNKKTVIEEIKPTRGNIEIIISTTGTVQPQNRLEIKPPISGRIEEILVQEGEKVTQGQIVAWMSSTERAALLDAARPKGNEALKYWEDAYKPTPLIAPIEGEVIVRSVEPGQTLTSADPVVVLSDRLIVKAQVDETDIGRVELGQKATVSLDAYPKEIIPASVDHISYESKLVNNVTIYEVDILPQETPRMFRSGMTSNINIVEKSRENVLRVPVAAIRRENEGSFILVKENERQKAQPRQVETGMTNEEYVEIISGLTDEEIILVEKTNDALPKKGSLGNNPFMPTRPQERRNR